MRVIMTIISAAFPATALGVDFASVKGSMPPGRAAPAVSSATFDASLELKWDDGTIVTEGDWYTGSNAWAGNDFDISTFPTYRNCGAQKIYYWPGWPDMQFQGNRVALFGFAGGAPGSLIRGPAWVRASGFGWQTYTVPLCLPAATSAFVLAFEQVYDHPNCDPVLPMAKGTAGHRWYYYGGAWNRIPSFMGGSTLMIRAIMDDEHAKIAPSSLGRVKALYY